MRRPKATRAQKAHAREMRALLALRRAALRRSMLVEAYDANPPNDPIARSVVEAFTLASLDAAADAYRNAIGEREARKLAQLTPMRLRELRDEWNVHDDDTNTARIDEARAIKGIHSRG